MSKANAYQREDILDIAVNGLPIDPLRLLATFADERNWRQVHADQRCYWSWIGPMITPYEIAQRALKEHTADDGPPTCADCGSGLGADDDRYCPPCNDVRWRHEHPEDAYDPDSPWIGAPDA